jgi:hypothetical protein
LPIESAAALAASRMDDGLVNSAWAKAAAALATPMNMKAPHFWKESTSFPF